MRLAFLVSRLSQLPHLEGIARVAEERHHTVILLADTGLGGGPKQDQVPYPNRWPDRWAKLVEESHEFTSAFLHAAMKNARADALLSIYTPGLTPKTLRAAGYSGVLSHVQASWSDLMELPHGEASAFDRIYVWSPSWTTWWGAWQGVPEWLGNTLTPFRAVGMPVAEQLARIDPSQVRQTFRLPGGQGFALYLPFPSATLPWGLWSHGLYGGRWPGVATERAVVGALRDYCDRLGLLLVVKARTKSPVPEWLARLADHLIFDEPGEPTCLRLLASGASLLVHHLSTTVAEAVAAGVPALCVAPAPWCLPPYARRRRMEAFRAPAKDGQAVRPEDGSFYSFGTAAWSLGPREAIRLFRSATSVPKVDPADHRAYGERFLGGPPWEASERIVRDLEGLL